jgi:hypothetical protein
MYVSSELRTSSITLFGESQTMVMSNLLVQASQWFSILPLPDDKWEITVKEENERRLHSWCAILGFQHISKDS